MKINLTWNVCRICLWESDELLSIYEKDGQDQLISDKISVCGGVVIEKDMNLPDQICRKCVAFLNVAYKFHVNCQNSDKILRAFIVDLNADTNISKSFSEYVAQESIKNEPQQNNTRAATSVSVQEYIAEEPVLDADQFVSVESFKVDVLDCDEQNEVNIQDEDEDGDFLEMDKDSSDPDYEEPPQIKKKPMRRKRSSKKPANTITLGSDGSAVIKPAEEKPLHICEVCGNKYTKKFALESHMKWHRDEKPFACEICGKKFSINFQLTRHMRTHTGQKPYECKFCGRKFSDLSTCIKHQRTHTNERPFKCVTCGKAFNYSHVLKVHMAVHTGEKPYSCQLCGKAFSQLHHLKAHLNTLMHQNNIPQKDQQTKDGRKNQAKSGSIQQIFALLSNETDAKVDSD